ncbi:unnamed protein product [Oikopleura dioica]|uniref:Complement component 1 Q subcomponent-binding protein, mitochondrial n=1 Tax=Oikopleura dioica TaxID=34765 RepID=E4Y342_OIKDI|nr:unnamed protein product [Oikopleura dioica]
MLARALFRPALRQIVASQSLVRPSVRALSRSDSEFLSWVEEQLEHEKARNVSDLSGGWSKPKSEGAIGIINREKDGEKVTVRFNLNGSMPTLEEQDLMEEKGEEPLCLPDFEIIVEKTGGKKIWLNCQYNMDDEAHDDDDAFDIISVMIGDDSAELPYVMNTDSMDASFYDQLMNFIEQRGIDEKFLEDLAVSATDLENNLYRQSLVDMKDFFKN